ncbi:hypothetical protein JVT61DRAFT_13808 [Boletus reticuloceps]|uniref:Uncharacterized protein n=1 Tax=Boletus reticuloceps TaxID=495285 RepID=A0A8I3AC70_9AGAM|nr:hypothetical protein JVT61DRAFT_13808 [Boletus reticuloceps]
MEISPYSDRIRFHSYNSIVPGTEDLSCMGATPPQLLPRTTPRVDVAHCIVRAPITSDYLPPSHSSSTLHHDEFNPPPQLAHPPYSLLSAGCEPSYNTPSATARRSLGFPQPSGLYGPWGSFHPSLELPPNAICDTSPPIFHHSTLDSTLQSNSSCHQSPWITGDIQIGSVDEVPPAPSNYDIPTFPPPNPIPFPHDLGTTSEPCSATLEASYPCQWTKGGVICNVMVQATRPHMNRHLHAHHGFGGPDTRQTKCYWAGCEATMQQGSIARHYGNLPLTG